MRRHRTARSRAQMASAQAHQCRAGEQQHRADRKADATRMSSAVRRCRCCALGARRASSLESLGVSQQTLRNWRRQDQIDRRRARRRADQRRAGRVAPAAAGERAPEAGARSAQTSRGLLRSGDRVPVTAYRLISAEKARTPVSVACRLLGVSRSGYYEWAGRAPSDRALTDAWLTEKIRAIHAAPSRRLRRAAHPRRLAHGARHPGRAQARGALDASGRRLGAAAPQARPHDRQRARASGSPMTSSSAQFSPAGAEPCSGSRT